MSDHIFNPEDDTDPLLDDLSQPPNMPMNPPNVPLNPPNVPVNPPNVPANPPIVQVNPPGSQPRPSQKKRELTLKHGVTMRVTACGPIDQTGDIKLKMDWSVPTRNIVNREIVIPWDDANAKKAKDKIWRKCGGPVFLDSDDQARDFPRFLEQRIDVLEAQKNEDGQSTVKPIKEFQDIELYEIWEGKTLHVYLIAGKRDIFLLGEDEMNWAHRLSDQEIESFPIEVYYTGPETNFEVNSKSTTELLFKIISNINQAQEEENHSFSLFSICSGVTAYLYSVRMKKIKNFVTTMTISGEGFSTGKSLMYEAIMLALYGKRLHSATPTTIPRLYEMLATGVPIYVREWSDDLWKILEEAAKACWEANGKTVNKVHRVPATAMFVSANLTVDEVEKRLKNAIRTKVVLLYTGDKRLKHPNLSELCEELLDSARELYSFLPSLVGLGVRSMMTKISTAQVQAYNGELRLEDDDREAQTLLDYDGFYTELLEKAREYKLDLPPLFQKNFIDHRALTGHHKNEENIESNLRIFMDFLETSGHYDLLLPASTSFKGKGYKVNPSDPRLPPQIKIALMKCTQSFSTTEDQKSVRRRFLDSGMLQENVASQLDAKVLASFHTYDSWLIRRVSLITKQKRDLCKQFYSGLQLRKRGPRSALQKDSGKSSNVPDRTGSRSDVPDRTGSGSTLADRTGSGSTVPDRTGSGSTVPDITGSGSNVPDITASGSNVPDRTASGSKVPGSDSNVPASIDDSTIGQASSATSTSTALNTQASGSSLISDRTCAVPNCGSFNRTFATLQYYKRHLSTPMHKAAMNVPSSEMPKRKRR